LKATELLRPAMHSGALSDNARYVCLTSVCRVNRA